MITKRKKPHKRLPKIVSGVQDLVATKEIDFNEEVTICYLPSAESGMQHQTSK
jgi:hypothetical protein